MKRGNLYYRLSDTFNSQIQLLGGDVGDYVEISSGRPDDIPAYGYISEGGATMCKITLAFKGDFIDREAPITMRNVKKEILIRLLRYLKVYGLHSAERRLTTMTQTTKKAGV